MADDNKLTLHAMDGERVAVTRNDITNATFLQDGKVRIDTRHGYQFIIPYEDFDYLVTQRQPKDNEYTGHRSRH